MKLTDFDVAIEVLLEAIRTDYRDFTFGRRDELDEINLEMTEEFEDSLSVKRGSKYTKIIKGGSVWGFIVNADNECFRAGDILKAASWAAPALNRARGNIFDGYKIYWTGPHYL